MGKAEGEGVEGPLARENGCGTGRKGGGKLAVNELRWVTGGELGAANGGSLEVLDPKQKSRRVHP